MIVEKERSVGKLKSFLAEHCPSGRHLVEGELKEAVAAQRGWSLEEGGFMGGVTLVTPQGRIEMHPGSLVTWGQEIEGDALVITPLIWSSAYGSVGCAQWGLRDGTPEAHDAVMRALGFEIKRVILPDKVMTLPSAPWDWTSLPQEEWNDPYEAKSLAMMFARDAPEFIREFVEGALAAAAGLQIKVQFNPAQEEEK
jgi:hypothetical protein